MSLKNILLTLLNALPSLQPQAKTTALKTTMIIYLTHANHNANLFDSDRHLLLQLVNPLVAQIADKYDDLSAAAMA